MNIRPAADIQIALTFFTRLPLPYFDTENRKLGDAIWAAPLVGIAVALVGSLTFWLADFFGVPSLPAAALILAVTVLLTGCLHEDGLADVADGFGGGKTVERKQEIMLDSRLGTYGATALLMSALIRFGALTHLANHDAVFFGLIAAHVGSRAIFARMIRDTPLAAESGLAGSVGEVGDREAWLALAIGGAALLVLGVFAGLVTALLVAGLIVGFRQLCLKQIHGINGDTLGAAQQIAECAILVAAAAALA